MASEFELARRQDAPSPTTHPYLELVPHELLDLGRTVELQMMGPDDWQSLDRIFYASEGGPLGVDWQTPAESLPLPAVLDRLAHVRPMLPADNMDRQKETHNKTLENYIRLALDASGNLTNLSIFLGIVSDNLRSKEPSERLARDTFVVWAPLADVIGRYDLCKELEDSAFRAAFPEDHERISSALIELEENGLDEATVGYLEEMRGSVDAALGPAAADLTYLSRTKAPYSIWRKKIKEGLDGVRVADLIGLRAVVVDTIIEDEDGPVDDLEAIGLCYAVMSAMEQPFTRVEGSWKDFIQRPKPNGYRSLQVTLALNNGAGLEIQVRTASMERHNEHDPLASHSLYDATHKITPGRYKSPTPPSKPSKMLMWRMPALESIFKNGGETSGILGEAKLIFVQDGNLYEVPPEATALDVSFWVHKREALRTSGLKVNGKQASGETEVSHGDFVTISYSPEEGGSQWKDGWFDKVRTSQSLQALERARGRRDHEIYVDAAVRWVNRVLWKERRLRFDDPLALVTDEQRAKLVRHHGVQNFDMVLRLIGRNAPPEQEDLTSWEGAKNGFAPGRIVRAILESEGVELVKPKPEKPAHAAVIDGHAVIVDGNSAFPYHFAGCCQEGLSHRAIIVAQPSGKEGDFSVHRLGCANLSADEEKVRPCSWYETA